VVRECVMDERSAVNEFVVDAVCGVVERAMGRKPRGIKGVDCCDFGVVSIEVAFLVVPVIPRVAALKM